MKQIIVMIMGVILVVICLLAGVNVLYNDELYNDIGSLYEGSSEAPLVDDSLELLQQNVNTQPPAFKYSGSIRTMGEAVSWKTLCKISLDGINFMSGETENGFRLYLKDIRDASGNSVLLRMSSEAIESIEEIPADVVYETDTDMLHLYTSGNYTMYIKVCADSGAEGTYEFTLPVCPE